MATYYVSDVALGLIEFAIRFLSRSPRTVKESNRRTKHYKRRMDSGGRNEQKDGSIFLPPFLTIPLHLSFHFFPASCSFIFPGIRKSFRLRRVGKQGSRRKNLVWINELLLLLYYSSPPVISKASLSFLFSLPFCSLGVSSRRTLSQLWSFEIRRATFLNYIKLAGFLIFRL